MRAAEDQGCSLEKCVRKRSRFGNPSAPKIAREHPGSSFCPRDVPWPTVKFGSLGLTIHQAYLAKSAPGQGRRGAQRPFVETLPPLQTPYPTEPATPIVFPKSKISNNPGNGRSKPREQGTVASLKTVCGRNAVWAFEYETFTMKQR